MAKKLRVDMNDILDSMTGSPDDGVSFYLDLQTGKVETKLSSYLFDVSGEEQTDIERAIEDGPERFDEIPRFEGRREYRLMAEFAESVDEPDLRDRFDVALQGSKGAFGRFRSLVSQYPDLLARWEQTRGDALLEEAREWLESLAIEPEYSLRPLPHQLVQQPPIAKRAPITLFDLLLLGAPDGKTELLDGQVARMITVRSPSEGRSLFKSLAREVCEHYGVAWRNRFIEGSDTFTMEGATLTLETRPVVQRHSRNRRTERIEGTPCHPNLQWRATAPSCTLCTINAAEPFHFPDRRRCANKVSRVGSAA
jgi:hypothetical protein